MSTLLLIRHGQASFGAADYDVLSDPGIRQGRELGCYWADIAQKIDALYTGPRRRHHGTAEQLLAGARSRGIEYPEARELSGLDEYPAIELLRHWIPILRAEDPSFAALWEPEASESESELKFSRDPRAMERGFSYVVEKWALGELDTGELESFVSFRQRVLAALSHIIESEGRGRTVAVVTSGGPICMAVQWALSLPDDIAMRQGWVIGNGSVSEFRYRDARALTLIGFNNREHLREPNLVTYR